MNFIEELQSLDANDIGRWPFVFRAGVIGIVFVLVVGLSFATLTIQSLFHSHFFGPSIL